MLSAGFVHFVEYELQVIALAWLGILYALKIFQLSRLPMFREKAPPKGSAGAGVLRSYSNMLIPWSMESSKKHFWRWVEFGAYHVGAGVAILNTFTSPFIPGMMTESVRWIFAILIAPAFLLGIAKFVRRIIQPEMRLVSTPDDYFAVVSVELFFFSAIMALILNTPEWRTTYFLITAAFLFYVPFSKISHYIYFFFAAIFTGSRYGYRGVRPEGRQAE